jgi:tRNA dimethylallyltransferase
MRSVGYRQAWEHLEGRFDARALRERGIAATRQLAKRQLTWMRSEQSLEWLDPDISTLQASWNRDLSQKLRELGL